MRRFAAYTAACVLWVSVFQPPKAFAFDWIGKVELAARDLSSKNPDERLRAVHRLGEYDAQWTQSHLLDALSDTSLPVRLAAARILGRARVSDAVGPIGQWLASTTTEEKKVAAEVLGDIGGKSAIPLLIRSLGDMDHEVRLSAVIALGKIGSDRVLVPIIARLEDDKPTVRQAAVAQLTRLGDRRAVVPLVGVFADSSLDVRVAAVLAVGRLGDDAATPALVRLLSDPQENVRLAAVTALGNLRAAHAAPALVDLLDVGSNTFRSNVAYALGQIARASGHPRAAVPLRALVMSLSRARVRAAAREALLAAGPAAVPVLIEHLRGDLGGDPETAVALLRDLGDKRATPALIDELRKTRVPRALILAAIRQAADARALLPVLGLLAKGDRKVRIEALHALGSLVAPGGRGSDVLAESLGDETPEIRQLAAKTLGTMRAVGQVPQLIALATNDADISVRRAAVSALGAIGDPRAEKPLVRILRKGPRALHDAAASALSFLATAGSTDALLGLASRRAYPSRVVVIRAIAGILRRNSGRRSQGAAIDTLSEIAERGTATAAVAAIAALGAAKSTDAEDTLLDLLASPRLSRRAAALVALGNLPIDAQKPLLGALGSESDLISTPAAWSMAKSRGQGNETALLRATKRRGFGTPVNASAALAHRAGPGAAPEMLRLLAHPRRLVRANAALFFRRHRSPSARETLKRSLDSDSSWLVRRNAALALARYKDDGANALREAQRNERHPSVMRTIEQALGDGLPEVKRDDWQTFSVIQEPDAPAARAPYFLVAADGLVTAHYTDDNGEVTEESFPRGPYKFEPQASEDQF